MADNEIVETAIYRVGVQGTEQTDKAAASLERVAVSHEKVTKATRSTTDAVERMIGSLDKQAGIQLRWAASLEKLKKLQEDGIGTIERHARAQELVEQHFTKQIALLDKTAERTEFLRNKYDPASASAVKMARAIAEINEAQRLGIVIAGGHQKAIADAKAQYDGTAAAMEKAQAEATDLNEALERQLHVLTPTRAAFKAYQQGVAEADALLKANLLTVNQHAVALARHKAAFDAPAVKQAAVEQEALAKAADRHKDAIEPLNRMLREYQQNITSVNATEKAGLITKQQQTAAHAHYLQVLKDAAFAKAKKEQEELTAAVDRHLDAIEPTRKAQRDYQTQLTSVQDLEKRGLITKQQQIALEQHYAAVLKNSTTAMSQHGLSARQMQFLMTNLTFQINDVVTGLASGQDLWRVFMQQGGQIFQIFQLGGRTLLTTILGWINPLTVAVALVVALAAAFAMLVSRATAAQQSIRNFDAMLRGLSLTSVSSAENLEEMSKGLRDVGLSADVARTKIAAAVGAGVSPDQAARVVRAGVNVGAALGIDSDAGISRVQEAVTGGLDSTIQLGIRLGAITPELARMYRQMDEGGKIVQANADAFARIEAHVNGLERSRLSPMALAIRDMNTAWGKFLDMLSKTALVQGAITLLASSIESIARWLEHMAALDFSGVTNFLNTLSDWLPGGGAKFEVKPGTQGPTDRVTTIPGTTLSRTPIGPGMPIGEALALIQQYENAKGNPLLGWGPKGGTDLSKYPLSPTGFPMWPGLPGPAGNSTAAGLWMITRQTWDPLARELGVTGFSEAEQRRVATLLYQRRGFQPWAPNNPQLAARLQAGGMFDPNAPAPTGAAGGPLAQGALGAEQLNELFKLTEARMRDAQATRDTGLAQAKLRAEAESYALTQGKNISETDRQKIANELYAAEVVKLENEIKRLSDASGIEAAGATRIAEAWAVSAKEGITAEATAKALTEAYNQLGTGVGAYLETEEGMNALLKRRDEILKPIIQQQRQRNNQDMLAFKDTQAQLQLETKLVGQTTDTIAYQVTLLQEKQKIEREFPFLSEKEKQARLAAAEATAAQVKQLSEIKRFQEQIDSLWRSIGDTIANTIGQQMGNIFDEQKPKKWGETLKKMFGDIASQIQQSLFVRPLVGSLLGMLGASPNAVQGFGQFGSLFGGGGGQTLTGTVGGQPATFNLSNVSGGFNLLDKLGGELGLGGSGSGGLFSTTGTGIFSPTGSLSGIGNFFSGGAGGIFAHTPVGAEAVGALGPMNIAPGSIFGSTTLGTAFSAVGLGFGAGTMLNSLMGGNTMGGTIGSGIGSLAGMALGSMIGMPFLGALLGGAGSGLLGGMFGNSRPSNQSAGGNINFATGRLFDSFSGGNQQIDQATQQVLQNVSQFTQSILQASGGTLSGRALIQGGVNTGFTIASTLPGYEGTFNLGKDAAAATDTIMLSLAHGLEGISATMKKVIDQITDPELLEGGIKFARVYDELKKSFDGALSSIDNITDAVGPFEQALDQVNTVFEELTDNAILYGLSLDPINKGLADAIKELNRAFDTSLQQQLIGAAGGEDFIGPIAAIWQQFVQNFNDMVALNRPDTRDTVYRIFNQNLEGVLIQLTLEQQRKVVEVFRETAPEVVAFTQAMIDAGRYASEAVNAMTASLIELRTALTTGPSSGLTLAEQTQAANDNFTRALDRAQGNVLQNDALAEAGAALIQLSEQTYGNAPATSTFRQTILAGIDQTLKSQGFAAGTRSTPPGMILVGERGPELISQPGGLRVWDTADTARIMSPANDVTEKLDLMISLLAGGNTIAREHGAVSQRGFASLTGAVVEGNAPAFEPPARRKTG